MSKDVHTEHCCCHHGCKFGEDDFCSVWLGYKNQSYKCEFCHESDEKVTEKEFERRRIEAENS